MKKIRILVVDDSATIRLILSTTLAADPFLEVVGTAADGRIALEKLDELRPDVVLLDVEMPEMDGLEALAAIRESHPALPVIMFSRLTQRGVEVTIDALLLGANDYVTKPEDRSDVERSIHAELIPKIKLIASSIADQPVGDAIELVGQLDSVSDKPASVIGIAASTGGPTALAVLLRSLPANMSVPIVVAQHMPEAFTGPFARRLKVKTELDVREAAMDQPITAAQVWIARGGFHMVVQSTAQDVRVRLNQDPPQNACRPSADPLFCSLADTYGAATLGVVLTGMGRDGLAGCRRIHEIGGRVLVQDQETSVIWGMAGAVAQAKLAEAILPLTEIGLALRQRLPSPN